MKRFVVIEGYSDESEPKLTTPFDDIPSAVRYCLGVRMEIMNDYRLNVDKPGEFGWVEAGRQRYCAIRKET